MAMAMTLMLQSVSGRMVTFDNTKPRYDVNNKIINAHDGTTRRYGESGPFYYHAMGYPTCSEPGKINGCNKCLYSHNNSIATWSSPDLSSGSWKLLDTIYPSLTSGFPSCTYFRSQVVYNSHTKLYVLWVNVAGCDKGVQTDGGEYAVGTATSPAGPFTFKGFVQADPSKLGPINNRSGVGDFALFIDDDGKAYNILTHGIDGPGHRDMYIFELSGDYLTFGNASIGPLPGEHLVEAPAFFKRGKTYYAFLGGCTCMGLYGGGVNVLTAASPLGPWTNVTATLDPGCPMFEQTSCFEMGPGAVCNPVSQAQQNFVMQVPLVSGDTAFIWTGDKWQQSPDGTFAEQPQTWIQLEFDGDTVLPFKYVDKFSLDVAV